MKKPELVIMAAGMGSRYGGLKQIDPVDSQGHVILDFSLYDAIRAGFETVIFIITPEIEAAFREHIGNRVEKFVTVKYVYQKLGSLPTGYAVPEGRKKPWGTGHAVLSSMDVLSAPFAVINADDYYGQSAYQTIYDYLCSHSDDDLYRYAMVGYVLENTLTDNGHVARGICSADEHNRLTQIHERTHIEKADDGVRYTEDDGASWVKLPQGSTVSMNFWGFSNSILNELNTRFSAFLDENLETNPLKCEYFLPFVVNELIAEKKATVEVLKSTDKWYGVTYQPDKEVVVKAIAMLKEKGLYPENLWEVKP